MKIAYIGDFINYGKTLQTSGTPIVILLSFREDVSSIDVYCPKENENKEEFELPNKVKIISCYEYDNAISIFKLLKIPWDNYDKVIFNLLPTGFGEGILANITALMLPLLGTKILRRTQIEVIYHNSVFTNDVKKLGYDSPLDKIKTFFLGILERSIFKNVQTFVLLETYKNRISQFIGKNKVNAINAKYLEAITTVYLNNSLDLEKITHNHNSVQTILMHGFWGPQKNLDFALSTLRKLRKNGKNFKLILSGGINHHFKEYENNFKLMIKSQGDIIDKYLGFIKEREIMGLFLSVDLLILPYNTPGGHSGVLEQAMFFEVPTISFDFPEYKEQSGGSTNVKLTSIDCFSKTIDEQLIDLNGFDIICIKEKLLEAQFNLSALLQL